VHAALQFGYANLVGVGVVVQLRGLPILHLGVKGRSQVKGAEQPRKARKA
jgi:hypothetical protein